MQMCSSKTINLCSILVKSMVWCKLKTVRAVNRHIFYDFDFKMRLLIFSLYKPPCSSVWKCASNMTLKQCNYEAITHSPHAPTSSFQTRYFMQICTYYMHIPILSDMQMLWNKLESSPDWNTSCNIISELWKGRQSSGCDLGWANVF